MTLNTYVAGEPASGHALADFLTRRARSVENTATGWHDTRKAAESDWDGAASEAFISNRATPNARDADALSGINEALGPPFIGWGDGIAAAKRWMEKAKEVAREGELKVQADAILPPGKLAVKPPATLTEPASPADRDAHGQASADFETAKALHAKKQAAYEEAQALVKQARDLERKSHDELRDALTKQTKALKHLGQFKEWTQAAADATTPAATGLMSLATDLENQSVHATRAAFEKAAAQNPHATNSMWSALTSEQRADLTSRYPQMVGSTNGVPAVDRDQANRSILESQRQAIVDRLNSERRRLRNDPHHRLGESDHGSFERISQLKESLAGIDKLESKLGSSAEESDYYLLGVDGTADSRGRAIVASGNPDTADHVMTSVPGTMGDLGGVVESIESNDAVIEKTRGMVPDGQEVAAVEWCDYETPPWFDSAGEKGYAERAAPKLSEFQQGLRATHEGPPSHNVVMGHSYGSTTAGFAARDHGLHSDDIAFLGSPGVGVDHAKELGVDPSHVWSGTSRDDEIHAAGPPGFLDRINGKDDQWFGLSPSDPAFGGNTIPTDPTTAHAEYWDKPESLNGLAEIVSGQHHQRP